MSKTHTNDEALGPLTREQVVDVAIAVGDEDGVDAVSFRRLGARLGVAPMALYRHVRNKEDLVEAMIQRLGSDLDLRPSLDPTLPWTGRLRQVLRFLQRFFEQHPVAVPLLIRRASATFSMLPTYETLLELLVEGGYAVNEAVDVSTQVLNRAAALYLLEAGARQGMSDVEVVAMAREAEGRLLALPADRYPLIRAAAAYMCSPNRERFHAFGIDLTVAGVEAMAGRITDGSESTTRPPPAP